MKLRALEARKPADYGSAVRIRRTIIGTHVNRLLRDLLHAARGLRREPRFAVVTILILAVGIGACTAMFSIVHAVLLRPMALLAADGVVMLWSVDVRHESRMESTDATQAHFQAHLRSFDEVALMSSVNWSGARDRGSTRCCSASLRQSRPCWRRLGSTAPCRMR